MNEGPALKEQKKKYGPESLAILSPARRSYSEYLYRFLIAHGSPNYGHSGICAMQKTFAFTYTLGAARAAGWQKVIGSLTPGKRADLVVLDRDLFAIVDKGITGRDNPG